MEGTSGECRHAAFQLTNGLLTRHIERKPCDGGLVQVVAALEGEQGGQRPQTLSRILEGQRFADAAFPTSADRNGTLAGGKIVALGCGRTR